MLREIRELGFEYAELSHGTRISLVPGILEAVSAGEIKISSLHNFCPLPIGVNSSAPNLYQFSAERERERELAHRYTLKTIELAERVRAGLVVLHLGSIEMRNYTDKLIDLAGDGRRDSPKYEKLCMELDEKREKRKAPYWDRVKESLKLLLPEAAARGVKFGIENREAVEELPVESDFKALLDELSSPNLVYWHDTGHAQIKENLGLVPHRNHLESLSTYLAGFHIHDVQFPARDHCPPGTGEIDFGMLKEFVRPEHLKVFELSPSLSADQVRAGVQHLFRMWGANGEGL
jgi:sugar phosphate isomerase/epimerase